MIESFDCSYPYNHLERVTVTIVIPEDWDTMLAKGWLLRRVLFGRVATFSDTYDLDEVKEVLPGPLGKVRSMMLMPTVGEIVKPTDSDWECLYSSNIIYTIKLVAYLKWHAIPGPRYWHDVADCMQFLGWFDLRDERALKYVPERHLHLVPPLKAAKRTRQVDELAHRRKTSA